MDRLLRNYFAYLLLGPTMNTFRCLLHSGEPTALEERRISLRMICRIESSEGPKTLLSSTRVSLLLLAMQLISACRALEARETTVS